MACTTALPTTAASACDWTSRTCAAVEIPNPMASGREVSRRARSASGRHAGSHLASFTGDPGARDQIEKARGKLRRPLQARVRGSGRSQKHRVQILRPHGLNVTLRLFRGQVHHQRAVHSRLRRAGRKFLQAVLQKGIEIAEQNDGRSHGLAPDWGIAPGSCAASCRSAAPAPKRAGSPGRRPGDRKTARPTRSHPRPPGRAPGATLPWRPGWDRPPSDKRSVPWRFSRAGRETGRQCEL